MKILKMLSFALSLSLFILASCATTTLTSTWKDPSYDGGKLKKILVVGVTKKPAMKRIFEDEFVAQLRVKGLDGVASYTVMPQDEAPDKNALTALVNKLGVDGVIVTRLVDKKTIETYYPPQVTYVPNPGYYGGWYSYYYPSYSYVTTPGYTTENQVIVLETNLYAANGEKLVWSGISETFVEDTANQLIKGFVQVIIRDISEKGLI
ncbi:MAG TPA: hypothetical protein VLD40_03555 [Dissulfurispiraceae bacterium]|nr:hypothetical protein [Dissulfurispiraceae bacterium]